MTQHRASTSPPAAPVRADNSHYLVDAARRRRDDTLARAHAALQRLGDAGQPVSVARLATEAGVSHSWIYTQPELLDQIQQTQRAPTNGASPTTGRAPPPPRCCADSSSPTSG